MIVDAHVHMGRGDLLAKDVFLKFMDSQVDQTIEVVVRLAEEAGIDKSVIMPVWYPTYDEANEEIADAVEKYPDKLIGFARIRIEREKGRTKRALKYAIEKLGLKGVKIKDRVDGFPTREFMDTLVELNVPMFIHPEDNYYIDLLAKYYPTAKIIIAHLGSARSGDHSEILKAIDIAQRRPNVYLCTSTTLVKDISEAVNRLGADKVIFGSDGPLHNPALELYKIKLLKLKEEDERKILCENIMRLLSLD